MPDSIPPGADSVGRAVFAKRLALVGALHRAGVIVLPGTDAPLRNQPAGFGLHMGAGMARGAGLSPWRVLVAATLEPARFLDMEDSLGTIVPGKFADLVLLDADPLADIRNTRRVNSVVANGRLLDSTTASHSSGPRSTLSLRPCVLASLRPCVLASLRPCVLAPLRPCVLAFSCVLAALILPLSTGSLVPGPLSPGAVPHMLPLPAICCKPLNPGPPGVRWARPPCGVPAAGERSAPVAGFSGKSTSAVFAPAARPAFAAALDDTTEGS